jgi:hypothetical protein
MGSFVGICLLRILSGKGRRDMLSALCTGLQYNSTPKVLVDYCLGE